MISEYVEKNYKQLEVGMLANKIKEVFKEYFGTDIFDKDINECRRVAKEIIESLST